VAQNIYDDPGFFAGYGALRRSRKGLAGMPEWPVMRAMLPPLRGLRVVDLGCGFGWHARWMAGEGAASVLGLDLSERMLARAREMTADPAVTYARADLEAPALPEATFDLATSALALHYVEDLAGLLAAVHRALVPGGRFVFSMEHPVFTAPRRQAWIEHEGRRAWPLEGYAEEGPRVSDWLAPGVVKRHRTLATLLRRLAAAGFALRDLDEFAPTAAQVAEEPALAVERDRPMFLVAAVERAG
jgi:SAM-dependent methyltransferase